MSWRRDREIHPIEETLEKDFDEILRTNVTAVFLTVQAALALTQCLRALSQLLMGAGTSIILNGSMAATIGTDESSAYAASKAGGAGDVPLARR